MLAAIITLSLLSLLVATEADPADARPESPGDEPLRPPGKRPEGTGGQSPKSGRIAA